MKSFATLTSVVALATLAAMPTLAQNTIKIGVPTAQSGTYAGLGNEAIRAVKYAVDEANAAGGVIGRKVEFRVLDTEAKPDVARRQAEKLALDGFKILTGTIASGEGLAMAPMLERWDALYVSTINKANPITGKECQPRVFRVNKQDAMDGAVVQPWLATRKEQKWAIMAADIAWGRDVGASFRKAVEANKRQIVVENYSPFGTKDFAAYIQQIKSNGAEGVWVGLAGLDAINFAQQAAQFGLVQSTFVGGVSFVTDNTVKTLGDIAKGMWGVINYSSTIDTPENKKLVEGWRKAYNGDEPTNFEGETYMGMQIIFEAMRRAKSDKPIEVAKAMHGGTFDTILGKLTMRAEDHQMASPNYFGVIDVHNGKLRPVVTMTFPKEQVSPGPSADCQMGKL
ncbi:MAG: branched-chain amino acid ABC transporter substrate-binding protein [Alphaproteobacteria bacterium]|nr:branched-chain amino acid ABC transporter substrate-binding protein [Alphaproteobacteria bacterium]